MESISIPNSVTSIGAYAFDSCSNLKSIEIPKSVSSIGDGAFNSCTNLVLITFNWTTETELGNLNIGENWLYGVKLKKVYVPFDTFSLYDNETILAELGIDISLFEENKILFLHNFSLVILLYHQMQQL